MSDVFSRRVVEVGPNMWRQVDRKMAVLLEHRAKEAEVQAELDRINQERRALAGRVKAAKK